MVGDQDPFPEDVVFQRFSFGVVDGPGQPAVGRVLAGEFPVDDGVYPGVVGDLLDLGGELFAGAAGFPAGQRGGEVVELPADLGQGGVGEGSGLVVVQVLRVGEHDPPVLAVDVAAGVDRGQARVALLVDGFPVGVRAGRAGRGSRWAGRTRRSAGRTHAGGRSWRWSSARRRTPRSSTAGRRRSTVGVGGVVGEVGVPLFEVLDQGGELGDVGPVPGVGVPDQWDPTGAGDDHAQPDQALRDPPERP